MTTSNGLNQYSAVAGSSFGYDGNGNLTSTPDGAGGTHYYDYDVENRLVIRSSPTSGATLRYDPLGRLYEVVGANGTTRFLHDGSDLVAEYDGSNTLLRRYVHGLGGGDDPQVWFEGSSMVDSARRYLYSDERGSVIAVTNGSGTVQYVNSYDDYGIPDGSGNDIATKGRFRYTGQAWIPELGMYYYKARMYSPTLGRFMQTDPIGYGDGMNMYAYVKNDPVNGVDPTGLCRGGEVRSWVFGAGFRSPSTDAQPGDIEVWGPPCVSFDAIMNYLYSSGGMSSYNVPPTPFGGEAPVSGGGSGEDTLPKGLCTQAQAGSTDFIDSNLAAESEIFGTIGNFADAAVVVGFLIAPVNPVIGGALILGGRIAGNVSTGVQVSSALIDYGKNGNTGALLNAGGTMLGSVIGGRQGGKLGSHLFGNQQIIGAFGKIEKRANGIAQAGQNIGGSFGGALACPR